jgi:hypothetical protein
VTEPGTADDMVKATQVASASGQAASDQLAAGGGREDVRTASADAAEAKAKEVGFTLSAEDRNAIADTLIERLDGMGAFAPAPTPDAPEPVQTPEAAADAQDAAGAGAQGEPPRKRTIAEKFAGI